MSTGVSEPIFCEQDCILLDKFGLKPLSKQAVEAFKEREVYQRLQGEVDEDRIYWHGREFRFNRYRSDEAPPCVDTLHACIIDCRRARDEQAEDSIFDELDLYDAELKIEEYETLRIIFLVIDLNGLPEGGTGYADRTYPLYIWDTRDLNTLITP